MWPEKDTAFIVIHGAGSHRPFEALDRFVRGFRHVLKVSNPGLDRWWRHELERRPTSIQHSISVTPDGRPKLAFYEYYWDCYVDREIALPEIIKWLYQVSDSAKRFYREHQDLAREHQEQGSELFKDGDFRVGGYFVPLGWVGWVLRALLRIGFARIPVLSMAIAVVLRRVTKLIAELMGDVVIFTTADARSRNHDTRERLLKGAVEELRPLLETDDYEQVIVVGHSLGSLIAYDALNRIIVDMNAEGGIRPQNGHKITGMVTLGSPLDKAAFYFREHTGDHEFVRRQILRHVHGFKGAPYLEDESPISIDSPIQANLEEAQWLNFYHLQDPVSGHLDAYQVDKNILCEEQVEGPAEAHRMYWTYDRVYEEIGAAFFGAALQHVDDADQGGQNSTPPDPHGLPSVCRHRWLGWRRTPALQQRAGKP